MLKYVMLFLLVRVSCDLSSICMSMIGERLCSEFCNGLEKSHSVVSFAEVTSTLWWDPLKTKGTRYSLSLNTVSLGDMLDNYLISGDVVSPQGSASSFLLFICSPLYVLGMKYCAIQFDNSVNKQLNLNLTFQLYCAWFLQPGLQARQLDQK